MDRDYAKEAVASIDEILTGQFEELAKKAKAGERLTLQELKLLEALRSRFAKGLGGEASTVEAELRGRAGMDPRLFEFKAVSEVAASIGCGAKLLKNFCQPEDGREVLPHRKLGKHQKYLVQPAVAYAFCARYCTRRPKHLHPPAGYMEATPETDQARKLALPDDPHQALMEIFRDDDLRMTLNPETLKWMTTFASEFRRKAESEAKRAVRLDPEDVVRMLRSFVQLFADTIDDAAGARAAEVLRRIRERIGIDLVSRLGTAHAEIENVLREQGNRDIRRLKEALDQQCEEFRLSSVLKNNLEGKRS